jgi:outer membrane protein assembly factor BamB
MITSMKNSPLFRIYLILTLFLSLSIQSIWAQQDNWTHFRGSNINAIATETQVPLVWNDSTNIMWKTNIEGKGWSSPVVYGNQVWVTTATDNGKKMLAVCVDINTGKKIYDLLLFQPDTIQSKHAINTYATPTCCIEEGFVYAHFGTYGTACINTATGIVVWKRTDLNCNHAQGPGSSPILYKDLLILHYDGIDVRYVVALDKKTGNTIWKVDRPEELYKGIAPIAKKAYITPIIVNVKGKDLLISNASTACIAYEPETGKEVWRIVKGHETTIASPIEEKGTIYYFTSWMATKPEEEQHIDLVAVNPDGKGDITKTNVLWEINTPIDQLSSAVVKNGKIYFVDSKNVLFCLDAKTGKAIYSEKMKQKYNASPIYAAGNIYFTSVKGETMVIKAGDKLQVVAENKLTVGEVYSTPAFVRNSMLFRSDKCLYRIATK